MIENITYHSQKDQNHCGPCCMSMILSSMDITLLPEDIAKVVMRKSIQTEIELAGTSDMCSEISHHNAYPVGIYNMPEKNAWEFLKNCVDNGTPVLVSQIKDESLKFGHGRVVTKIEKEGSDFMIHCLDPDEKDPITQMSKKRFFKLWDAQQDFAKPMRFGMFVIRKNRSKLQKKKCIVCDSSDIETHTRKFDHADLKFINPDAVSRMNGTIFRCNECSTEVHHFP